jgi:serine/threonine protein kinase
MNKLLSEGGFGCIYHPGYTCKGKKSKDLEFVTKVHKDNRNAKNETFIGKYISSHINDYKLYFLPVISKCPISLELVNNNTFEECSIVQKYNDFNFVQMKIPYIANKPFFAFLTDTNHTKKDNFSNIIETYEYLLRGIEKLIQYNIIHFDLKTENILYNNSSNTPLIIDFGISILYDQIDMDKLKRHFYIYAPDYYIWCLEIHVISFILHELKDKNEAFSLKHIKTICHDFIFSNKGLHSLSKPFINKMYNASVEFLKPYIDKSHDYIIKEMISFYKTWDNYSLSVLYLQILHLLFEDGFIQNNILTSFTELLLDNIHPNPNRRHDIAYTIKTQQDIFYENDNYKNYLNLLEYLNYKNIGTNINTLHNSLSATIREKK